VSTHGCCADKACKPNTCKEIEMEDINVKCCRCRNTHLHSARKESAPDRYGMRTLVCPRCGAKEFYKPEPKKGQPQPSGD
jgi:hypothetical protein